MPDVRSSRQHTCCGQTTLELAELLGASGRVLGVDISEQMLERARARVVESGFGNIELVIADAATHGFEPAAFDLVFSRFGVMFFEDALGAFGNLRHAFAGFGAIVIEPLLLPIHSGGSATLGEAVDYCCQLGPAARLLSTVDPALRPAARDALRSALEPFVSDRGVWLDAAAWIVTANASGTPKE